MAEIVPAPAPTPPPAPAAVPAVDPMAVAVAPKRSKPSKLANFVVSLNYIGMGKERTMFIENMATLLGAGLPIPEALKTIEEETRVKPMKKIVKKILESVESGTPLWVAMQEQNFFTTYAIALVRIGEEAGSLARNMGYLAIQQEKDAELRSKVKMAMIYPSVVIVLVMAMVIILGVFVLPNLVQVLISLNAPLPFATRMLIAFANFSSSNGTLVISLGLGSMLAIFICNALVPAVKRVLQWVAFHVPGIGPLARAATIARFGVILGGLLQAGVPLPEAMRSLTEVTTVLSYRDFYARITEEIMLGQSFQKTFGEIKASKTLFPVSVTSLIVVGERSGTLSQILLKIADIYDKKAAETAQKLPVVLEPMLLIFIGGLVGFIAFSILTPIYSVVGNISH